MEYKFPDKYQEFMENINSNRPDYENILPTLREVMKDIIIYMGNLVTLIQRSDFIKKVTVFNQQANDKFFTEFTNLINLNKKRNSRQIKRMYKNFVKQSLKYSSRLMGYNHDKNIDRNIYRYIMSLHWLDTDKVFNHIVSSTTK